VELLSIEKLFGYGIYVELRDSKVTNSMFETDSVGEGEWEAWLFGRVHIIISDETRLA